MISSKMNRTNGGSRSSRIFVGILLIALACLIVLYYHEHRSAKNAEALSVTLEQQTRAIDESLEKFLALKETCRNEREQLTKANEDQETKIDTALQQAQDWQQRYERVMNDKNTMENELKTLKSEMQSLQQKYDDKQNEASSLRGQLANKLQQCESDKQQAADEAIKLEQTKCAADKQQLSEVHQQLLQDKQQLQVKLDHCESAMKEFSEQLRKDTEQQGIHSNEKAISLPSLNGQQHHTTMEDQLSQKLKERFIKQMDDDKSNQQVALSHPQNNNHLPDENLSSKNVMNYFNDKGKDIGNDKDIGSFFDDKQQQEPSKDIYFNKKQSDPAELANKEDSTTNDNPAAHMIHVGISHDKTNDTDFAIEQKDVNKTTEAGDHNGMTDDHDNNHIGEADDHDKHEVQVGGLLDDNHDDVEDNQEKTNTENDQDTEDDREKSLNKLLLGDDDDNGNHDDTAETDQDLFKIPRLPDLHL